MALNFSGLFPPSKPFNVNYDWIDVAGATGHIEFNGLNAFDTDGDNWILIQSDNNSIVSDLGGTNLIKRTEKTTNGGTSFEEDFDLTPFQLPRTLEGDAFFRIGLVGAGANVTTCIITAKIRKWDGSLETEIASKASAAFTLLAETTRTLQITVPRTHFKKGENLRLTVTISSADSGNQYRIGHDPQDKAVASVSAGNTKLSLTIPFKLDFL